jgi:hypothetical protein
VEIAVKTLAVKRDLGKLFAGGDPNNAKRKGKNKGIR